MADNNDDKNDPLHPENLFNHMLEMYMPKINFHAKKLYNAGRVPGIKDPEDLHEVGIHALHEAIRGWDPKKDNKFSTYFESILPNRMTDVSKFHTETNVDPYLIDKEASHRKKQAAALGPDRVDPTDIDPDDILDFDPEEE